MTSITIGNEHLEVAVSPLGSEMQSIVTRDGRNWLWNGDAAFWGGRSPVLFPIVGKAPEDHIGVNGTRYPMGQHGFARRSTFTLVAHGEDFCRFELRSSAVTQSIYPFSFVLTLEHRVAGRAVSVTAEVSNVGDSPMPYGIGFHPAFVWPLPGCEGLEHQVTLDNGGEPDLVRLTGGLVRPERLASPFVAGRLVLKHDLFEADAMIFPEGSGAGLRYGAGDTAINFSWDNLPNLALWSKRDAPFICLEPWHGMAAKVDGSDDIARRPFGVELAPGETGRYGFKVELIG